VIYIHICKPESNKFKSHCRTI